MTCSPHKSLLLCLLLLPGCAALPVSSPEPGAESKGAGDAEPIPEPAPLPEAPDRIDRTPAVATLLAMAREDRAQGRNDQAAVRLERALRIQPRDPALWLELARVYYDKREFATAVQFANKAERLSGLDEMLRRQATELLSDARRQGG